MDHKKIREDIEKYALSKGVSIVEKDSSWLMKIFSLVLFFNKRFMSDFITTVGKVVYFPKRLLIYDKTVWTVTVHELVHAYDMRSWWRMLITGSWYLFPQILSLLSIFSIFYSWWFLLFLLFLTPIPSYGRYWAEVRGYTATLATYHWRGLDAEKVVEVLVPYFINSSYYWMWPFKKSVEKKLRENTKKIKDGTIEDEIPILKELRIIVEKHKEV